MSNQDAPPDNSKERVAFELMKYLSGLESSESVKRDRAYFFTLFRQCYKASYGDSLTEILKNETLGR
jgi:hypothetical protein